MPLRAALLAVLVALVWGFNFVVMKWGVAQVPPLLLLTLRFALAAVPAIFFVARPQVPWRTMVAYALAFGVVKFAALFFAFRLGMTAGVGSVLLQAQVFFTIAFAALAAGERPSRRQTLALLLASAGLAVIGWGSAAGAIGAAPFLLVVFAAASWGIANMISKAAGKFDPLAFVVWTSAAASPPLLLLSLIFEGQGAIGSVFADMTPLAFAAVLYLAWPVTLLALAIWSWLIANYAAAAIAPYALLVPVFGLASASLVLGEVPNAASLVGSAIVVVALVLNLWAARVKS